MRFSLIFPYLSHSTTTFMVLLCQNTSGITIYLIFYLNILTFKILIYIPVKEGDE